MELTCPKCQGPMRSYERTRIVVDQCVDCRGIFLDRGELEALLEAEATYYGSAASTPPPAPASTLPVAVSGGSYVASVPPAHPALRVVPPPGSEAPSWGGDDDYADDATFDARYDPAHAYHDPDEPDDGHGRRRRSSFLRELFD